MITVINKKRNGDTNHTKHEFVYIPNKGKKEKQSPINVPKQ